MTETLESLSQALQAGKINDVAELTRQAMDQGVPPRDILQQGLLAGMDVVGKKFKAGDMFIPEVLRCAKAMHSALDILRPSLAEGDGDTKAIFLIATVEGDLHDIGKNLVAMMLEGAGFTVIDLGIDQKASSIVEAVQQHRPQLLGLSALLTTTIPKMEEVIQALESAGLRDQVKVMVGGAPVTEDYAQKIGADGYAPNAATAVDKAREFVQVS
jgi:corrinoid protein of di/trimethylamine methyltransferase